MATHWSDVFGERLRQDIAKKIGDSTTIEAREASSIIEHASVPKNDVTIGWLAPALWSCRGHDVVVDRLVRLFVELIDPEIEEGGITILEIFEDAPERD